MKSTLPNTTPRPLWLAIHECGHPVSRIVNDETAPYPGPFLRSLTVYPVGNGETLGECEHKQRVVAPHIPWMAEICRPKPETPEHALTRMLVAMDIVETMAGPVAEIYQRSCWYGAWSFGRTYVQEHVQAADQDAYNDASMIRRCADWLGFTASQLEALWIYTCQLISTEWPGIVRIARVLLDRGTMDGGDFEEEWRRLRSTPAIRARLARPAAARRRRSYSEVRSHPASGGSGLPASFPIPEVVL